MNNTQSHSIAGRWDAGTKSCSQLIIGLRNAVAALGDGELLEVHALDDGAPADIPAWCRMTRHTLVAALHPVYTIRK
ncbi:MAG TPA: sulfurtransferase TusA family protein [Woeseiaceae bacterium]|jgi:tRNA 2-thiouridine synthesizing protein A|nr:sulfurtransferase TusA family protein [Woeseiaceae bacterium]